MKQQPDTVHPINRMRAGNYREPIYWKPEPSPRGLVHKVIAGVKDLVSSKLKGEWARAYPRTAQHVAWLQSLANQVDKAAPSTGNGILVRMERINEVINQNLIK